MVSLVSKNVKNQNVIYKSFIGENIISVYVTNNITNPDIKMWAIL